MKKSVLLEGELENLLKVKTSVAGARIMKKRFQWVLDHLDEPNAAEDFGCPHCLEVDDCPVCAYNIAFDRSDGATCLEVPFGGVIALDVERLVILSSTNVAIVRAPETPEEREQVEVWAKGHIEWADAVLAKKAKGRKKTTK